MFGTILLVFFVGYFVVKKSILAAAGRPEEETHPTTIIHNTTYIDKQLVVNTDRTTANSIVDESDTTTIDF